MKGASGVSATSGRLAVLHGGWAESAEAGPGDEGSEVSETAAAGRVSVAPGREARARAPGPAAADAPADLDAAGVVNCAATVDRHVAVAGAIG